MLLKQLAFLLVIFLSVSSENLEGKAQIKSIICENEVPESCLTKDENLRKPRSIKSPITDFLNKLKGAFIDKISFQSTTKPISSIECTKGLVINIDSAIISNVDKTKCKNKNNLVKNEDCTDNILATIITTQMCNGKSKCKIALDKNYIEICKCSNQKYLETTHSCVKPTSLKENVKSIKKRYIRLNYNLQENRRHYKRKYFPNTPYKRKHVSNENNLYQKNKYIKENYDRSDYLNDNHEYNNDFDEHHEYDKEDDKHEHVYKRDNYNDGEHHEYQEEEDTHHSDDDGKNPKIRKKRTRKHNRKYKNGQKIKSKSRKYKDHKSYHHLQNKYSNYGYSYGYPFYDYGIQNYNYVYPAYYAGYDYPSYYYSY